METTEYLHTGSMIETQRQSGDNGDLVVPEAETVSLSTLFVEQIAERALAHLRRVSRSFRRRSRHGKTTLAFHVAAKLGRPVSLFIHGDEEFDSSDLVGQDTGYRKRKLVDNYIHSVLKTEEEMHSLWVENLAYLACRNGDTLIYDEFNRSRPEANNPF